MVSVGTEGALEGDMDEALEGDSVDSEEVDLVAEDILEEDLAVDGLVQRKSELLSYGLYNSNQVKAL